MWETSHVRNRSYSLPHVPWPSHTSFIAYIFLTPTLPVGLSSIPRARSLHLNHWKTYCSFSTASLSSPQIFTSQSGYLNHQSDSFPLQLKTLHCSMLSIWHIHSLLGWHIQGCVISPLKRACSFISHGPAAAPSFIKHTASVLCAFARAVPSA